MTYRDLLRLPQWQKRRLERLQLAGWACEKCGAADRQLQVHHKRYFRGRQPWDYEDDELEVLCDECHAGEHGLAPPRRRITRPPMRTPADRVAWILLRHLDWWSSLAESEQACLQAQQGWHGELFRFVSTLHAGKAADIENQPWWSAACALLDAEDPAIEPLRDDLPRSVEQLIEAPRRLQHLRILGQA